MTPEEKSLLERTHKLAEENNSMLRSMRRSTRIAMIFRVIYWVVILIIGFGAFYFIQPYVQTLFGIYGDLNNGVQNNVNAARSAADSLKDLFK